MQATPTLRKRIVMNAAGRTVEAVDVPPSVVSTIEGGHLASCWPDFRATLTAREPQSAVERAAWLMARSCSAESDLPTLAYWASWYKEGQTLTVDDGQRQAFTGSDDDVIRDIGEFRALGVRHLLFTFARPTVAESVAAMERFSEKVLSRV